MILFLIVIWILLIIVVLVDARELLKYLAIASFLLIIGFTIMDPSNFLFYIGLFGTSMYVSKKLIKTA